MREAYLTLVENDKHKRATLMEPEVLEEVWLHEQMMKESHSQKVAPTHRK